MKQGPQTMRQVIAPKAGAVQNIATCAAAASLQFSLLCSSVSAIAGYSGQARLFQPLTDRPPETSGNRWTPGRRQRKGLLCSAVAMALHSCLCATEKCVDVHLCRPL